MNIFFKFFFFIFFAQGSILLAQETSTRYLHVSTTPSETDIYLNDTHPDFANSPDFNSPAFIPIPEGENQVLIALFRPTFTDTLINVTLSQKDTSFIIITMQSEYENNTLENQQKIIAKRSRRRLGHRLLIASAVPFLAGGIAALISSYEIDEVNKYKERLENSLIQSGNKFQHNINKYNEHRDDAKTAKTATISSFIAGGIIFSAGIILSF